MLLSSTLFLFSLVNLSLGTSSAVNCPSPPPDEIILVDCGSIGSSSLDGRLWDGDSNSKFGPFSLETLSECEAARQHPIINSKVPYMSARISNSDFTYSFPISPGPKFIRLYFYPSTYNSTSNFDTSNFFFTVTANNYTLLNNFHATLDVVAPTIKEFIVTVQASETLYITFIPSRNSVAFINGIEIVPIPDNLYIKNNSYLIVDFQTRYNLDSFTALETIYRLNVGGSAETDAQLFRKWADDKNYIDGRAGVVHHSSGTEIQYTPVTTCYTAPEVVYTTVRSMGQDRQANLEHNFTWKFSVDSGFNYLLRLHFCETDQKHVNATGQRRFSIFINNVIAEEIFDVFFYAPRNDIPVYRDYVVLVPEGNERKQDFWLALHPRSGLLFSDPILNGLEIFKLSKSNDYLSGIYPVLLSPPKQGYADSTRVLPIISAVLGSASALCILVIFFVCLRKVKVKDTRTTHHKSNWWLLFSNKSSSASTSALSLPTDLCRQFTNAEIRTATRNFHDENVIGCGDFGTVYKGFIQNGSVPVAVKRLGSSSKQGIREFYTEIHMLSKLRHAHLVSLIGYCDDQNEMILVYEFMDQGNLQDHIYKAKKVSIPWKQRLQICIGAAKGLHYLHTGATHTIIHRDVKSSNILLDSNWMAKVSDFGLSKLGPTSESQTHVSTVVKGSFGYLDPEYYRRQQLTVKSDVYAFGVVLLEVVYGRPPRVLTEPKEQVNSVEWARKCFEKGTIAENIDPQLKGEIATVCLNKFMEIAESCVRDKATERPTIGDVVWGLEFSLQLQETTEKNVDDDGDESQKNSFVGVTNDAAQDVFSDIMNLHAR